MKTAALFCLLILSATFPTWADQPAPKKACRIDDRTRMFLPDDLALMCDIVTARLRYIEKAGDGPFRSPANEDGTYVVGTLKNRKPVGRWSSCGRDDAPMGLLTFDQDGVPDGPWSYYGSSGQLLVKGSFAKGKLDGPFVSYHPNGMKACEAVFNFGMLADGNILCRRPDGSILGQAWVADHEREVEAHEYSADGHSVLHLVRKRGELVINEDLR